MTSGLHDIDGQVVAVWKYRFDIVPGAWECPAFKATADLIRSRNGAAYENTEQLVPLSRISAQGEYVPSQADQLGSDGDDCGRADGGRDRGRSAEEEAVTPFSSRGS